MLGSVLRQVQDGVSASDSIHSDSWNMLDVLESVLPGKDFPEKDRIQGNPVTVTVPGADHGVVVQAMKQASSGSLSMEKATCDNGHSLNMVVIDQRNVLLQSIE